MEAASLHLRTVDGVVVARVEGELDLSNAINIGGAITQGLSHGIRAVVIDLTGVTYLDSAGIQLLFRLRSRLQERALRLSLVLTDDMPVAATLRWAGVLTAIPADPTVEEALRALGAGPDVETGTGTDAGAQADGA